MSEIIKYIVHDPLAEIMIIKNAFIEENTISLDDNVVGDIFLPTMYRPWYKAQPSHHIKFKHMNTDSMNVVNDILYIFDTWGQSSFYHFLIDTIIPVWVTKKYIEGFLRQQNIKVENSEYLLVSTNGYDKNMCTSEYIFKHFLGNNYISDVRGKYKYIVYGSCHSHRPLRNDKSSAYSPAFQFWFDKFISEYNINYIKNNTFSPDNTIIIPTRLDRNVDKCDEIFDLLGKTFNIMKVDFAEYTIDEQIQLSSNAFAMVGSEGAGFANQIFMKKGSIVICLFPENRDDYGFHSSVARYMNHTYQSIIVHSNSDIKNIVDMIISSIKKSLEHRNLAALCRML